ncbi:MAG TPA: S-adenosyl-L-homocysteine hydrolase [Novosphingobium sp.]|nr:S-adenosyl-L-homocysteine hydrolase [Novosphingobium sp.]
MTGWTKWAGALPAAALLLAPVGAGAAGSASNAEKLRRLDIMLMVTALRCRSGTDDFQTDFQAFEGHHLAELNQAAHQLRDELAAREGAVAADRALDRLSVVVANQYGGGHPWLGCHELKGLAHELAREDGVAPLLDAADATLKGDAPVLAALP